VNKGFFSHWAKNFRFFREKNRKYNSWRRKGKNRWIKANNSQQGQCRGCWPRLRRSCRCAAPIVDTLGLLLQQSVYLPVTSFIILEKVIRTFTVSFVWTSVVVWNVGQRKLWKTISEMATREGWKFLFISSLFIIVMVKLKCSVLGYGMLLHKTTTGQKKIIPVMKYRRYIIENSIDTKLLWWGIVVNQGVTTCRKSEHRISVYQGYQLDIRGIINGYQEKIHQIWIKYPTDFGRIL